MKPVPLKVASFSLYIYPSIDVAPICVDPEIIASWQGSGIRRLWLCTWPYPLLRALAPLVTNGHGLCAGCRHRTILSSGWGWLIEGASYLLCGSGVLTYSPALSCEQSPVAPKKVNTEFPGAWSPEFHSGHAQNSRLGQLPSMLPARSLIYKQLHQSTQHCFWWLHF